MRKGGREELSLLLLCFLPHPWSDATLGPAKDEGKVWRVHPSLFRGALKAQPAGCWDWVVKKGASQGVGVETVTPTTIEAGFSHRPSKG